MSRPVDEAMIFAREARILAMREAGTHHLEIAAAIGLSPSAVRNTLARAKAIRRDAGNKKKAAAEAERMAPVVEVRRDGVRVTRCPPGYALHAHFLGALPGVRGAPPADDASMAATIKAESRLAAARAKHRKEYPRVGAERQAQRERADAVAGRVSG
jgi:DNA-binding CsgD family transcriptional regulator